MQSETPFPITLTPGAVQQVKRIQEKEGKPNSFLRIGVKGGGCSGLEYVLRLDEKTTDFDRSANFDGVEVRVDAKSAVYLTGTVLDYTGQLLGGGFKFENPNAARSCGCGTSFTPK